MADTPEKSTVDSLFGDEDRLPPISMTPGSEPSGRRGLTFKLVTGGVAFGLFLILWFVSSNHHEKYYLELDDGTVYIERGYYFPIGSGRFSVSRSYEPFRLPDGMSLEKTGPFSEETLDQTLYELFLKIAEREIEDLNAGDPEVAEDMLRRASKLRFTSPSDDQRTFERLGDVRYRRGLTELKNIDQQFLKALDQFRQAARMGGVQYKGAERWVETITRQREEFRVLAKETGLDPEVVLAAPPEPQAPAATPAPAP